MVYKISSLWLHLPNTEKKFSNPWKKKRKQYPESCQLEEACDRSIESPDLSLCSPSLTMDLPLRDKRILKKKNFDPLDFLSFFKSLFQFSYLDLFFKKKKIWFKSSDNLFYLFSSLTQIKSFKNPLFALPNL